MAKKELRNPMYCIYFCQLLCLNENRGLDCIGFERACKDWTKAN